MLLAYIDCSFAACKLSYNDDIAGATKEVTAVTPIDQGKTEVEPGNTVYIADHNTKGRI